jgi:hypothetical protein
MSEIQTNNTVLNLSNNERKIKNKKVNNDVLFWHSYNVFNPSTFSHIHFGKIAALWQQKFINYLNVS